MTSTKSVFGWPWIRLLLADLNKALFNWLRLRLFSADLGQSCFWLTSMGPFLDDWTKVNCSQPRLGLFLVNLHRGYFWSMLTDIFFGQPWLGLILVGAIFRQPHLQLILAKLDYGYFWSTSTEVFFGQPWLELILVGTIFSQPWQRLLLANFEQPL